MSEETIVKYCAPTLSGLKTASLFTCGYTTRNALQQDIGQLNTILERGGMHAAVLGYTQSAARIYIYRKSMLERDLSLRENKCILQLFGYDTSSVDKCLSHLLERLSDECFPHEIGLFLGYPLIDVIGFMEKKECLFSGLWKVYGDVEETKQVFETYKNCTESYECALAQGKTLEDLIQEVEENA